jgi:hypothetical protein
MRPIPSVRGPRLARLLAATAFAALQLAFPASRAFASFHLIEINKIMTSYNGDATIQAVELRMLANGQNLLTNLSIRSYDAAGVLLATHGTFASSLPAAGALTDRKVLCATPAFVATFGITPDLVITDGLPAPTGQVSFETIGCLVNAIAYGDVTVPKDGTTSGPPIPSGLAYVLSRTVDDTTVPSCPLAEDAAARFVVKSASSAAPVPFSNNAGATVNVFSTLTGVDVRGSFVRSLSLPSTASALYRGDWDGRDAAGRLVPAGVYFIRFGRGHGAPVARIAVLR